MNTKTLNIEFLKSLNACESGIDFVKRANLEGFPLDLLDQVEGDHNDFVSWLREQLKSVREYNSQGLMTKHVTPNGNVHLYEYNEQGLMTKKVSPLGAVYTWEYEFDNQGRLTSITGDNYLKIPGW